jgi:hypothetical protein
MHGTWGGFVLLLWFRKAKRFWRRYSTMPADVVEDAAEGSDRDIQQGGE